VREAAEPLDGERGEGIVSALLLLAGALLPLLYLVSLFGRVEQAELTATQAASAAVRAAVLAPDLAAAQSAASAELAAAREQTSTPLALSLSGSFSRGGLLAARVTVAVPVGSLPFVGSIGTLRLQASARAPVDLYRSFPGS
jgi:hypothetical protein